MEISKIVACYQAAKVVNHCRTGSRGSCGGAIHNNQNQSIFMTPCCPCCEAYYCSEVFKILSRKRKGFKEKHEDQKVRNVLPFTEMISLFSIAGTTVHGYIGY